MKTQTRTWSHASGSRSMKATEHVWNGTHTQQAERSHRRSMSSSHSHSHSQRPKMGQSRTKIERVTGVAASSIRPMFMSRGRPRVLLAVNTWWGRITFAPTSLVARAWDYVRGPHGGVPLRAARLRASTYHNPVYRGLDVKGRGATAQGGHNAVADASSLPGHTPPCASSQSRQTRRGTRSRKGSV
jgi:hypothetical protein